MDNPDDNEPEEIDLTIHNEEGEDTQTFVESDDDYICFEDPNQSQS